MTKVTMEVVVSGHSGVIVVNVDVPPVHRQTAASSWEEAWEFAAETLHELAGVEIERIQS